MRKIIIVSANRAEKGLLLPIMTELLERQRKIGDVQPTWYEFDCTLPPHQFLQGWESFITQVNPDIVVIPCDRAEMTYIASYCFNNGYLVAHVHAGSFGAVHPDDMNRRAISCFSHILLCNEAKSQTALWRLGEERWRTFLVGSTAFDSVKVDASLCPADPFDLVMLHSDPVSVEATRNDLKKATEASKIFCTPRKRIVVWLRPNKDKNHEVIDRFLDNLQFGVAAVYADLPRPQFLGLLKNAQRCIGNSSSFIYEKPYLNPTSEVVMIGHRNSEKKPLTNIQTGASKKIAEILATIPLDERLRRKKLAT